MFFKVNQMDNRNSSNFMENQNQVQDSTQESRVFIYEPYNINYVNTSKIYNVRNDEGKDVKVDNFLCYQEGNTLMKVTQISYEDKIVRIEDRFELDVVEKKNDQPNPTEGKPKGNKNLDKVRIFYQDSVHNIEKNGKVEKKDKKNIVKNIVKIFSAWLEKKKIDKDGEQYEKAQEELRKMLSVQNFNNRLIKNIISHEVVSKFFLNFLDVYAEEQVKFSRIHDKDSHYQAISLYRKLLQQQWRQGKKEKTCKMEQESTQKRKKILKEPLNEDDDQ